MVDLTCPVGAGAGLLAVDRIALSGFFGTTGSSSGKTCKERPLRPVTAMFIFPARSFFPSLGKCLRKSPKIFHHITKKTPQWCTGNTCRRVKLVESMQSVPETTALAGIYCTYKLNFSIFVRYWLTIFPF
jgi:hypothetical protein